VEILILSDTHGYMDDQILEHARSADETWHAGDLGGKNVADALERAGRLRAVYGNVDGGELRQRFPLHQRFTVEDVPVFMTHIGGYPGRYERGIKDLLKADRPRLFISGHSHIVKVMRDASLGNLIHINPGAAGKEGFHKVRTLVKLEIAKARVFNVRVLELGQR
jgi:putative phosphoesterase